MLIPDTDVPVAEETAPDSSTENEPTAAEAVPEGTPAAEEQAHTVPYERFREANEQAKRSLELEAKVADLEAKLHETAPDASQDAIKEQIKALGFAPKDELKAEYQAELKRRDDDARIDRELSQLEAKYSGSDGRPKFDRQKVLSRMMELHDQGKVITDPEVLYKSMHEKELTDWNIQQALTKTRGVKTEGSDGSGSSQVGTTNDDLKTAIRQGDKGALKTFLKRVTFAE